MLRPTLLALACTATAAGCMDPGTIDVRGSVDVGYGCDSGADSYQVTLDTDGGSASETLYCGNGGSFMLSADGGATGTLGVAAYGCGLFGIGDQVIGTIRVPITAESGFVDVGALHVPIDECP